MQPLLRSHRPWVIAGGTVVLLLLLLTIAGLFLASQVEPRLHAIIVQTLEERFDSDVTLEGVEVSLLPSPMIEGRGLVLRYQGRTDLPPLISVQRFAGTTGLWGFLSRHVEEVELDGLEVTIPPRRRDEMPSVGGGGDDAQEGSGEAGEGDGSQRTIISRLTAANTRLTVMSRDAGKMYGWRPARRRW